MVDIKKKTDKDLSKLLGETREKIRKIQFDATGARTANTQERKNLRKLVAQIMTEMNMRNSQE